MKLLELGYIGEEKATQFILKDEYTILERNYITKYGEIDIIAHKGKDFHFIEVKTRRGMNFGLPRESVSKRKQQHIKRAAMLYLAYMNQQNIQWNTLSFDVIEVYIYDDQSTNIHFIPNCF